jgi:type IV pilus assembly protein PilW
MSTQKKLAGFSLVEIMVAMVIALLGIIIIFQVFSVSESIKRTSTGGGDALQNGMLALYLIERDARMSGFGINFTPLLGCATVAHNEGPPVRDFTFILVGAEITDGASGAPDSVKFVYGSSSLLLAPAKLTTSSVASGNGFKVDNRYGFNAGDVIVAGEVGSTKVCSLRQVTSLPVNPADAVTNASGTYVTASGNSVPARYNSSAGIPKAYATWDNTSQTGGRLFDLGAAPVVGVYAIQNGQLTYQNLLTDATANVVADGIVQFQIQYGRDTVGDGAVHSWDETIPASPTAAVWATVIALRMAVVARSNLMEKPNATTGVCDTTTIQPTWTGGTLTVNTDPNWQCYRYRVFETTVPVRNMIWPQAI